MVWKYKLQNTESHDSVSNHKCSLLIQIICEANIKLNIQSKITNAPEEENQVKRKIYVYLWLATHE